MSFSYNHFKFNIPCVSVWLNSCLALGGVWGGGVPLLLTGLLLLLDLHPGPLPPPQVPQHRNPMQGNSIQVGVFSCSAGSSLSPQPLRSWLFSPQFLYLYTPALLCLAANTVCFGL